MELVLIIISVLLFAGVTLAILEHRRKNTFLAHDLNNAAAQTEIDRELLRTEEKLQVLGRNLGGPNF